MSNSANIYANLRAQAARLFKHNRQGSYKTRERYFDALDRFCHYLADVYRMEKLANISPKHIRSYVKYMQSRELSASTINTDLAAIRFWHDQMPDSRCKLPLNASLNLERRAFGKVDRTWSSPELNRLLLRAICEKREDYAALICLARYAGLRIHECFRIDTQTAANAVKTGEITVKGKGGKLRKVPIQERISIDLEKLLRVTPRGHKLFVPDGVPTDVAIKRFQQWILAHRDEVRDADSTHTLTFHGLRHTFAQERYTEFITAGYIPLEARRKVSKLLGHVRDDVTNIYLAGLKDGDCQDGDGDV
jgi:site-specific recombinase XerD